MADRFRFGENWKAYSRLVNERRSDDATASLSNMFARESFHGLSFLDVGCGSGLFSLAARRLGAVVDSFDYDTESVMCTEALKDRFAPDDADWRIHEGSVLDAGFMAQLGCYDMVYAWGVLHHTGRMWDALDHVTRSVKHNGSLFIALYNEQGWLSRYWWHIKRLYVKSTMARAALLLVYAPYFVGLRWGVRRLRGRRSPERGMSLWYDMKDWLGGYPFEVARPGEVVEFLDARGFQLKKMVTCGGRHGCNEYVFLRRMEGSA